MAAQERKWQIENDADTLKRAAEIQGDPSRLKPARSHLTKQMQYIEKATQKPLDRTRKKR